MGLLAKVFGSGKKKNGKAKVKYSSEWIRSLSDEKWHTEREKVRRERLSKGDESAHRVLDAFDRDMRRRVKERKGDQPVKKRPPREHGYNLYKED